MARQSGTNDQGYKVVLQGGKVNKVNQDVGKILCNSERESSYCWKAKSSSTRMDKATFFNFKRQSTVATVHITRKSQVIWFY